MTGRDDMMRISRSRVRRMSVLPLFASVAWGGALAQPAPMTVADMIETSRMWTGASREVADPLDPQRRREIGEGFSLSPGGDRFASFVVRGDIAEDRLVVDILSARLDSLASAAGARRVAQLSGRFRGNTDLVVSFQRMFEWIDDNRIVLRWEDADGVPQVFRIDLRTGLIEQLTHHPGGITFFMINAPGTLVYSTRVTPAPGPDLLQTGGLIRSGDAFTLASGRLGDESFNGDVWDREWYIQRPGQPSQRIDISGGGKELDQVRWVSFSPDGRWLVLPGTPLEIPQAWDRYSAGFVVTMVEDERLNPRRGALARQLHQLYAIDLQTGVSRVILAAPLPLGTGSRIQWSPDGSSFIWGPTYLPTPTDPQGLTGRAVVEVEVASGRTARIPVPETLAGSGRLDAIEWISNDLIVMTGGSTRAAAVRSGGQWHPAPPPEVTPARAAPAIELQLRQDENTPPRLFAIDTRTHEERLVYDPNPALTERFALGHVERFVWAGPEGRRWNGVLYYPVGYQRGRRYPLVIQTHGLAGPGEFSLNGMGGSRPTMGVGVSIYAAQPLAGRGIFVLQMEDQRFDSGPEEAEGYMHAYEAGIAHLDRHGFIDPARVGLAGYSRTGWHALYALTHSSFEFAAAVASDNIDAGYFSGTLIPGYYQHELGSMPFDDGLENWLERSPGFSVNRVRTPLRLQMEGVSRTADLLQHWEVFARLRHLGRPVEFNVVPDVLHGSHWLQNPAQALASQEGAVDWFDFWLNDRIPEGTTEARRAELLRLRGQRDQAIASPREPLLDWTAQPRP